MADVSFKFNLSVESDWQLIPEVTASFQWTTPIGITVVGQRITLRGIAEEGITRELASIANAIEEEIKSQLSVIDAKVAIEDHVTRVIQLSSAPQST